ncbi:DUF551 domain-containing protein [Klebsiella aerogenes]
MTNNQLTDQRIAEILARAEICDDSVLTDYADIAAAMRELQERRKAAMDSEPVELPLDYLQGHKDGLEWAAQLAEANHPETGDWLYDDPIELAKAIRKGPDMPPAQPAPVVPEEITSASAPEVFEIAAEAERLGLRGTYASYAVGWNACRAAMLAAAPHDTPALNSVQSVVTVSDAWIPVSERMPIPGVDVLVAKEFFGPGDWRRKVGHVRHEDSGWNIYGASWAPTHWMPLPAAPQEVKGE